MLPGILQRQDFECCYVGRDGQLKAVHNEQGRKAGKSSRDRQSFLLTGFLGRGKEEQSPSKNSPEHCCLLYGLGC